MLKPSGTIFTTKIPHYCGRVFSRIGGFLFSNLHQKEHPMNAKPRMSIKELAEEFANQVWNNKSVHSVDQFVEQNVHTHSPLGEHHGAETMKSLIQAWLDAFPDLHVNHDRVISEGDVVCAQWRVKATHQGEFQGIKPTRKLVAYNGVTVYRFKDHKIAEYWAYVDMQHVLNQLRG
jgi:steroid delta-isomerase-like uncharacterized protein